MPKESISLLLPMMPLLYLPAIYSVWRMWSRHRGTSSHLSTAYAYGSNPPAAGIAATHAIGLAG